MASRARAAVARGRPGAVRGSLGTSGGTKRRIRRELRARVRGRLRPWQRGESNPAGRVIQCREALRPHTITVYADGEVNGSVK